MHACRAAAAYDDAPSHKHTPIFKVSSLQDTAIFNIDLPVEYDKRYDTASPDTVTLHTTGADLRVALDAVLSSAALPADFKPRPSIGCNIKCGTSRGGGVTN